MGMRSSVPTSIECRSSVGKSCCPHASPDPVVLMIASVAGRFVYVVIALLQEAHLMGEFQNMIIIRNLAGDELNMS